MPPSQFDLFIPHKVLFAPLAVRSAVQADQYPLPHEGALRRLQRWQMLLADEDQREKLNEESYKAEFLTDIFTLLLGYRSVGSAPVYNMRREVSGPDDRGSKVVQERLGHASIQLTLDTYSHIVPGVQERASERLDAMLATPASAARA